MRMKVRLALFGQIGSGKTTLLHLVCHSLGLEALPEPFNDNPYLPKMLGKEIGKNECCKKGIDHPEYCYNFCPTCGEPLKPEVPNPYPFLTQLWFLYARVNQYIDASVYNKNELKCNTLLRLWYRILNYLLGKGVGIERSVFDDAEVFLQMLFDAGTIRSEDYTCYLGHFNILLKALSLAGINKPEKVVFVTAPIDVILERIRLRGRPFESYYLTDEGVQYLERLNKYYMRMYENWNGKKLLIENVGHPTQIAEKVVNWYKT